MLTRMILPRGLTLAVLWAGAGSQISGLAFSRDIELGCLPVGEKSKTWLPNLARLDDGTILCAYVQGTH